MKNVIIDTTREGNRTKLILKNTVEDGTPTKLGHAIDYLPHGIIDKTVTGLGGTTLELDCKRNSIIVEPLKFTLAQTSFAEA